MLADTAPGSIGTCCESVLMSMCMLGCTSVEVRRQLERVCSLFPPCVCSES